MRITAISCQLSVVSYLLTMIGCATVEYAPLPQSTKPLSVPGLHHRVEKGQTLWRVSKLYGVSVDEIVSSNNITDVTQIRSGQAIFIPRGERKAAPQSADNPASFEDFVWPVRGKITSNFGEKNQNIISKGITLRPYSNSNVVASASGQVVFVNENLRGYGKTIIIAHRDGIMTIYTSLSQILVKPGDYLRQGSAIARCENGLFHFELRKGHIPQNPRYYLPG